MGHRENDFWNSTFFSRAVETHKSKLDTPPESTWAICASKNL